LVCKAEMKSIFNLHLDYQKRVYGLDIYRAIAIILVVIAHGATFLNNTFVEGFPWIRLMDGVDLFFVLSGFLIGTILLKTMKATNQLRTPELINFWKRRWFRTLPLYYLFLLINWLLVNYSIIEGDLKQFNIKFLFFLHNFSSPFYGFFWESWSLSVEEWFYIFLPLMLFLFSFFLANKRAFFIGSLVLIIAPLAYRIYLSPVKVDWFWWDVTFRKTVLTRMDAIGYGIFAAWIKYYYEPFWTKYKNVTFVMGLAILIVVLNIHADPNSFYAKTISFTLISIGATFLLPKSESVKTFKTRFGKIITHISVVSYPMYLINLGAVSMVISKQFPPMSAADGILKYFIYWILVITLSTFLHKYYEKPIMDLRDRKFNSK
jgi:peptidoglycan/LPS O-acetylase OafA/YrhL